MRSLLRLIAAAICFGAVPVMAQSVIDRVDPARIERETLLKPDKSTDAPPVTEARTESGVAVQASNVEVGAIVFEGLAGLTPTDFADIIARYIGRSVSSSELARLAEEVAARARGRGYVFATVSIAPQRLTAGVLTISYDPGIIDEIRLEGSDNPAVRASLAPLLGKPARMADVERRLLIADDIDGVTIRRSRMLREGGRGILALQVIQVPLRVRVVADNDSTAPIGPVQMRLDADANGVFASDDALKLTYVATPLEPTELQYVRARYSKRVSRDGTELSISASASSTRPGAYLSPLNIHGRGWTASIGALHPLHRMRDSSLWANVSFDLRDSELRRSGQLRRHDRIFALRFGLYGNRPLAGGVLRSNVTLSRGLNAFAATKAGDPLASREDANGIFANAVLWTDWTRPLGGAFSVRTAVQAQVASRPLLVAEEIGIGGAAFLRGYDYSERSGDQGAMGSAEIRYDWVRPFGLLRMAQVYAFIDAGRITNLASGFGGGSLASGGGGLRADVSSSIDASIEVAMPLSGPRYETKNHNPRISFRLLKVF